MSCVSERAMGSGGGWRGDASATCATINVLVSISYGIGTFWPWLRSRRQAALAGKKETKGRFWQSFPLARIERFDRTGFLPYTSVFVRDDFSLSGAAPSCWEPLSWKGNIFGPGTM